MSELHTRGRHALLRKMRVMATPRLHFHFHFQTLNQFGSAPGSVSESDLDPCSVKPTLTPPLSRLQMLVGAVLRPGGRRQRLRAHPGFGLRVRRRRQRQRRHRIRTLVGQTGRAAEPEVGQS